jgi:DNA-binding response OmpR family regulator
LSKPGGVVLVSNHEDTADLYTYALEEAGYAVTCASDHLAALDSIARARPLAVVVHLFPYDDPLAIGALLRRRAPGIVLVGLVSVQLSMAILRAALTIFDDVVMIPCAPDALVDHVKRLDKKRHELT